MTKQYITRKLNLFKVMKTSRIEKWQTLIFKTLRDIRIDRYVYVTILL